VPHQWGTFGAITFHFATSGGLCRHCTDMLAATSTNHWHLPAQPRRPHLTVRGPLACWLVLTLLTNCVVFHQAAGHWLCFSRECCASSGFSNVQGPHLLPLSL
jgi:hypothetical protein